MKKVSTGFTIIELVVVIVIIGILAAVALPRFLGLQDKAHDAVVEGTQAALASGILMAHSLYLTYGRDTALDDVMKRSVPNATYSRNDDVGLDMNAQGYPVFTADDPASNSGASQFTNDLGGSGTATNQASIECAEVFRFLMSDQSVKVIAQNATGTIAPLDVNADTYEFFATGTASPGADECTYTYLPDLNPDGAARVITYNLETGATSIAGLTTATFSEGT